MPAKKKETTAVGKKTDSRKSPAKTKQSKKVAARAQTQKDFYVVGMGASAGGLEAFEKFFLSMSEDSGMAFILVPHLDPTHASIMPDLMQKYTKMKVIQIEDGITVQPNSVYIVPPNKDLAILHGTLQLIEPTGAHGLRMPIDYFFRCLAEDQREKAICVILSGMGTDGTFGLKAIKGELGMAMVQDPNSAKYDAMPRSAIQTGLVDYILPPEKMPEQLIGYTKYIAHEAGPGITPTGGKTPDALQKIFVLLRTHTGHDFSAYKQNTICRRVERRINVHQIDNVSNYVRYLQQNPNEVESLFKELLIGVTNFFRDPEGFESLKQKALPQLLKDKPNGYSVRAWVPGCSSGEEAYSVAILLRECMAELKRTFNVQIFGTDLDTDAINAARLGIYPNSISVDVSPDRLKRFFRKENNAYRIKKEIREMLVFAPQDIVKDPPFTKLDLLCCRNLLIYLNSELQKKLLPIFHYSLRPDGILFLGSSETTGGFVDLFAVIDKRWKIYKRKESASATRAIVEFPVPRGPDRDPEMQVAERATGTIREVNLSKLIEKTLLENFAPPCVITNEKGDIFYIHGRTGKYLEPAPGKARWNILEMAREGLKLRLPSAMRKAKSQKKAVTYESLQVKGNGSVQCINLTVKLMGDQEALEGLMMVVFEDMAPAREAKPAKTKRSQGKKADERIGALEEELQYTKENLQSTIEELETSNEELKSTNEELQSTNEELQSANEELETSKEELQSLNEELVTVNTELEGKIDELSVTNNDMKNLLDSIAIPTLFLDNDLCVKRFTKDAGEVINLIHTDIGRPISHIVSKLKYNELVKDARGVLKNLAYREQEVESKDGRWYLMRIMPYRTVDNVIDGVVITFSDIHEQKMATESIQRLSQSLEEARDYADSIINTVREPLVVLDGDLRVISANRSFYDSFRVKPKETRGELLYDLGNRQWDIPRLRELLGVMIPKDSVFEDFEVEHEFPGIGFKKMLLNARKFIHKGVGKELILLAIEDVTGKQPRAEGSTKGRDSIAKKTRKAKTPKR
jgi:two-component system CheB/CheR fusion protein